MHRTAFRSLFASALGLCLVGCFDDGGGGSGTGFQLVRISLLDGAIWKVNQEIVFTFSEPVSFSSVSLNTISIQTAGGAPATGSFFLRAPNQVVFQPNCPTLENLADTGLQAGGVPYLIRVLGRSSGAANTVRSAAGASLEVTQVRDFTTDEEEQAFLDTDQGPPIPVLRDGPTSTSPGTYIEIGGDPDNRVYFLPDDAVPPLGDQDGDGIDDDLDGDGKDDDDEPELSDQNFRIPLNHYSDPTTKVAVVIEFNQPVNPSASNISSTRLALEFLDGVVWRPLETRVSLVANCTETGARVRLEPVGPLPRGSKVRALVRPGLQDLVGEAGLQASDIFAIARTRAVDFASLVPADETGDEFPEHFDFGGTSPLSFQDTTARFETPGASWSDGRLTAAFAFDGTGGPGGAFDWLVEDGDSLIVDTDGSAILAADGVTVQVIQGQGPRAGVIDVQDLTIEQGGTVRVQGSRPLRINATGTVTIDGLLDVSGFDARDVVQVNTGATPELGAAGGPGGGRGGNANEVVTSSSPRGGFGQGPQGEINAGGQGGETGFAPVIQGKDARRPGGGAGGRFARDGAQAGTDGRASAMGAVTGQSPPLGGALSPGPFVDANTANDFFGSRAVGTPGNVTDLIRGELPRLWGGYGGGGGGNANPSTVFPTPGWTSASDEKGGAGGGGGGGVYIRALGSIVFGGTGLIRCDGGRGATGENVLIQDHVGGSGGSGSGGHVVLETASSIVFPNPLRTWITARGGPQITGAPTTGGNVSFGGGGGPGVIQLHVPNPLSPVANANTSPAANVLVPSFGARSKARSRWISVGRADRKPGGVVAPLSFLFRGIETAIGDDEGKILDVDQDELVDELPELVDRALEGNPDVSVLADRLTLRLQGEPLTPFTGANDLYLRNPTLLEDFVLRLYVDAVEQDFQVARASYDDVAARLDLTVSDQGVDLQDFINANTMAGTVRFQIRPRFFRVVTGGVEGRIPANTFVRILFQATEDDGTGAPNDVTPLVDWTAEVSLFDGLPTLQFFRFEVEFELDAGGLMVQPDTQPISLDFLRLPFRF
jgi:hypothetical protein